MKTFHRLTVALLVALSVLAGCRREAPSSVVAGAPQKAAANVEFAKFVDDYFDANFAFSPTAGTDAGLHQYDAKLEVRTRDAYEARIRELHGFLDRLTAIDRGALAFDEQVDAKAIEGDIRASLLDLETLHVWQTNPMSYASLPGRSVGSIVRRDFAPAKERLASVVSRLEGIPALYDACMANVDNPPREFTDLSLRISRGSAGYFETTLAAWAKEAAGDDAALLARFDAANAKVVDATRRFANWLDKDLLPRSKGSYAIGAERFLEKLRYEEMVDMPLPDLLAMGEAQLEKDYAAFVETAKAIDPSKTPAQVMASLSDEHPSAEDLIPSVRRTVDDARKFVVEHDLVTIPSEIAPTIDETPVYERSGSFASMDTPGPFETKATEAFYYVTPVEADWDAKHKEEHLRLYNPYVVAMVNVHEAYPGHYLQFLYAPKFRTKTRKILFSGSNAEGWAHYAEQMMLEEGFGGSNPKYRLAQLQEALLRDCRYVVGIKLHTEGWSVEQGAKLFVEKGFQEPANAYEESRRGAYNPTYLYYTLGKIEIYRLRDEYMKKRGATKKQFHDAFVTEGSLPIALVREILLR